MKSKAGETTFFLSPDELSMGFKLENSDFVFASTYIKNCYLHFYFKIRSVHLKRKIDDRIFKTCFILSC